MPQLYAARVQPHLPGYKLDLGGVLLFMVILKPDLIPKLPVLSQKPRECALPD